MKNLIDNLDAQVIMAGDDFDYRRPVVSVQFNLNPQHVVPMLGNLSGASDVAPYGQYTKKLRHDVHIKISATEKRSGGIQNTREVVRNLTDQVVSLISKEWMFILRANGVSMAPDAAPDIRDGSFMYADQRAPTTTITFSTWSDIDWDHVPDEDRVELLEEFYTGISLDDTPVTIKIE